MHRNRAVRGSGAAAASSAAQVRAIACPKSRPPATVAQSAVWTPGAPPSPSTSIPESSASAGSPLARAAAWALIRALPTKVSSVSSGSGRPSAFAETTSTG